MFRFAQAAEKGPSAALARSRGAAAYGPSTPRTCTHPPDGYPARRPAKPRDIWTFLSSLGVNEFFRILLEIPLLPSAVRGRVGCQAL